MQSMIENSIIEIQNHKRISDDFKIAFEASYLGLILSHMIKRKQNHEQQNVR